ncbi:A33 protein, partial [Atractosteus spatula]|nr:A33 protein [Atractosteus spatula]
MERRSEPGEVAYRTVKEVDPEDEVEIRWGGETGSHVSSAGRVSLYKRTALLFASLWILTLIVGVGFYFYKQPEQQAEKSRLLESNSALQIQLETLQMNYSSLNADLQIQLETLQKNYSSLNADMQNQMEALQRNYSSLTTELQQRCPKERNSSYLQGDCPSLKTYFMAVIEHYLPIEKCFPIDTTKTVKSTFSELSRMNGEVLTVVWKWIRNASADVTLDPETAHPSLILSEDGKQVRLGDQKQTLPESPQRFDPVVCVLGREGFSSGRHYWEVVVGEKTGWDLGVAKESINRKGKIILSPSNGYWTIWLRNANEFKALANPPVLLPLSLKPQKVGIYLDYEEGQVSFYNVETRNHIYTFTDTFTEKLYPYFSPNLKSNGTNAHPMIITSVDDIDLS